MFNKWINEPKSFNDKEDVLEIEAAGNTDFFISPISDFKASNAPVYVMKCDEESTLCCKIKSDLSNVYDAGAIFLYINSENWIKFALEHTDLGYNSVVSVVTDNFSDDSNGEKIPSDNVWMKLTRKNNIIGLYYSIDGHIWKMVRLFKHNIKSEDKVFIGLEAQSPTGAGCLVEFSNIIYTSSCVEDLRKGI